MLEKRGNRAVGPLGHIEAREPLTFKQVDGGRSVATRFTVPLEGRPRLEGTIARFDDSKYAGRS